MFTRLGRCEKQKEFKKPDSVCDLFDRRTRRSKATRCRNCSHYVPARVLGEIDLDQYAAVGANVAVTEGAIEDVHVNRETRDAVLAMDEELGGGVFANFKCVRDSEAGVRTLWFLVAIPGESADRLVERLQEAAPGSDLIRFTGDHRSRLLQDDWIAIGDMAPVWFAEDRGKWYVVDAEEVRHPRTSEDVESEGLQRALKT